MQNNGIVQQHNQSLFELFKSGKFSLTPNGLEIYEQLTFQEWADVGRALGYLERSIQWAIGDWLLYGESRGDWGETYTQVINDTGLQYQTLQNYTWVASRIPKSLRVERITWSHHREVAALDNPELQTYYLNLAADNDLSVRDLQDIIKGKSASDTEPETITYEGGIIAVRGNRMIIEIDTIDDLSQHLQKSAKITIPLTMIIEER